MVKHLPYSCRVVAPVQKSKWRAKHLSSLIVPRDAPLERLPPELRRRILFLLRLEDLRALVQASPVFHGQYAYDRRLLLCSGLEMTLCDTTVDAHAAYRSSFARFKIAFNTSNFSSFVEAYQTELCSPMSLRLADKCDEEEAAEMAAFFLGVVQPLVTHLTHGALDNLAKKMSCSLDYEPASTAEKTRLVRALYRFQLCCNFFGPDAYHITRPRLKATAEHEILGKFADFFNPWEVEEIAFVHSFAIQTFNKVLHLVEKETAPDEEDDRLWNRDNGSNDSLGFPLTDSGRHCKSSSPLFPPCSVVSLIL